MINYSFFAIINKYLIIAVTMDFESIRKQIILFGFALLLTLCCFALHFNLERIYGDAAVYLQNLIINQKIELQHFRPATYLTHWLPLVFLKFGANLKCLVLVFSFSEWLLLFVFFTFSVFILKNNKVSVCILVGYILCIRWNYFNPVSEFYLSLPVYFALFYFYDRSINKAMDLLVLIFAQTWLIFCHPSFKILIPFFYFFLFLYNIRRFNKIEIGILILCFIAANIAHLNFVDEYEKSVMLGSDNGKDISALLGNILSFNFAKFIFGYLIRFQLGLIVLTLFNIFYLFRAKNFKVLIVYTSLFTGYFFYIIACHGHLFPNTIEPFERYLAPLVIFSIIVFVFFILLDNSYKIPILFALAAIHVFLIYDYGTNVRKRYNYINMAIKYTNSFSEGKIVFRAANLNTSSYGHIWSISNESLILSSINYGKSKQIIIKEAINPDVFASLNNQNYLFMPWWTMGIPSLNKNYFNLNEGEIKYANTDAIQVDYDRSYFNNIKIDYIGNKEIEKNQLEFLPITIFNSNKDPVRSGREKEKIAITYEIFNCNEGSKVFPVSNALIETPILADVNTELTQNILIRTPKDKGKYLIKFDLIFESKRWGNINSRFFPIEVY